MLQHVSSIHFPDFPLIYVVSWLGIFLQFLNGAVPGRDLSACYTRAVIMSTSTISWMSIHNHESLPFATQRDHQNHHHIKRKAQRPKMLFRYSSRIASTLLLFLPNILARPDEKVDPKIGSPVCGMPNWLWSTQSPDLSAEGPHRICVPRYGDEGTIDYDVLLTCIAGKTVHTRAVDRIFNLIHDTANATRINGKEDVNVPLAQASGLGDKLARGHGFCRVSPNGDWKGDPVEPKATDPNPDGACVAMWNNLAPSTGEEWDLGVMQQVADVFSNFGNKRPKGISECHFGVFKHLGTTEFASGCWGKYDKTRHLSPEGKTTFSCPLGT